MGIRDDLVDLADYVSQRTLTRLDGLSDDEFRWEPVPGAWTVRRLRDGRPKLDNCSFPIGAPAITSIAWRVAHLVDIYGATRNWVWLRAKPVEELDSYESWRIAWTADESVALLRDAVDRFVALLRSTDDALLGEKIGPIGGPYAEGSLVSFVHHQLDEAIHHGAEVGILRDLYAARSAAAPEPATVADAADLGRWDLVEAMVEDGHDADATVSGRTALHQAAANGDLEMVRYLVEHGARTDHKDPVWNGTPLVWARHFSQQRVADYLLGLRSPTAGDPA